MYIATGLLQQSCPGPGEGLATVGSSLVLDAQLSEFRHGGVAAPRNDATMTSSVHALQLGEAGGRTIIWSKEESSGATAYSVLHCPIQYCTLLPGCCYCCSYFSRWWM